MLCFVIHDPARAVNLAGIHPTSASVRLVMEATIGGLRCPKKDRHCRVDAACPRSDPAVFLMVWTIPVNAHNSLWEAEPIPYGRKSDRVHVLLL